MSGAGQRSLGWSDDLGSGASPPVSEVQRQETALMPDNQLQTLISKQQAEKQHGL
jgi:hypothetical protein